MTTNELEAVFLVNLCRSYNKAAELSGMAVSTIHHRVQSLQAELGGEFFVTRPGRNMLELTEFGKTMLPGIQKILSIHSDIRYQSENQASEGGSVLRVGMPSMPGYCGIGELLAAFHRDLPACELITVIRTADELVRYMINGDIDCCFMVSDAVGGNISNIKHLFTGVNYDIQLLFRSEDMFICLSENDPLSSKEDLRIEDLMDRQFIFNTWSINHKLWENERRMPFFSSFGRNEDYFRFTFEDYTTEPYLMRLVAEGYGVVPLAFCSGKPFTGTVGKKLSDWSGASYLYLVSRRSAGPQLAELKARAEKQWLEDGTSK